MVGVSNQGRQGMGWLNGRVDDLALEQRKELIAQQRAQSRRYLVVLFLAMPLLLLIGAIGELLRDAPYAWRLLPWRIALALASAGLAVAIRRGWVSDGVSAGLAVLGIGLISVGLVLDTRAGPAHLGLVQVVVMLLAMMVLPLTIRVRSTIGMVAVLVLPLLCLLAWRQQTPAAWWSALAMVALGVAAGLLLRRERLQIALELFQLRRQLELRADLDMLTGLFNREGWFRSAREVFTLTRNARRPLSLAYLDLDHFKQINDDFGHAAGDVALAAVADMMRRHSRRQDVVGRLGGEEFVLLMPGVNEQAAVQLVQALCEAVRRVPAPRAITFSAGVCQVRITETLEAAMRRADHALLQAKREGRDRVLRAS